MRTLEVLDILAKSEDQLGATALAARLSLHRSTVHRLLLVLEQHRLIQRSPGDMKYRLGMKLFELGNSAVAPFDLRERPEPFLTKLAEETGEDAQICVLDGAGVLSIDSVAGSRPRNRRADVVQRGPVHCTSAGKVLLAFLSEPALDRFIAQLPLTRFTDRTLVTAAALKAELARVRECGFAVDNGEMKLDLRGIAAPIYNGSIYPRAALTISGPAHRFPRRRIPELVDTLSREAKALSKRLRITPAALRSESSGSLQNPELQ
jgi:DNA-binding IclR family transcriptional regulator